jgi:hypothetical protein
MNLNESFDIESLPVGTSSFDPLPPGWYRVVIKEASVAKTKAGTGEYIKIRYDVDGPSHGGRVVFGNLNISNPNPKAEEIGRQQLGELMRAIGLRSLKDTDQLVGGSLEIKLAIRESEQYGNSNDIKAFKSLGGAPKASPAAAPAKPKAPWLK